jgi:pyridoxine 5-phosphate synthase
MLVGNVPNLLKVATDIQNLVPKELRHPRPDERHIRYQDARDLKAIVYTEYNIEGNPEQTFIDLVLEIKPTRYPSSRCYRCDHIKCGMEYRKT